MSKIAIFGYPLHLTTPPLDGGVPLGNLHQIFCGCPRMAQVPNDVET